MKSFIRRHLPFLFLSIVLCYAFYPTLSAPFSIVDDHDMAELTGWGFSGSQLWAKLKEGDFWHQNGRFIPLYWLLRYTEGFLMGFDVELWRYSRLALALSAAALMYSSACVLIAPFVSALCVLLFFTQATASTYIQLAQPENLGLVFVCMGLARLLRLIANGESSPKKHLVAYLLMALAGFIKESFIPVVPVIMIYHYLIFDRVLNSAFGTPSELKHSKKEWSHLLLVLAVIAIQVTGVVWAYRHYGNPYYPTDLSFYKMERMALANLFNQSFWLAPFAIAFSTWLFLDDYIFWKPRYFFVLFFTLLVLALLPQWLIYRQRLFLDERFAAIPALFFVALTVLCVWYLRSVSNFELGKRTYSLAVVALMGMSVFAVAQVRSRSIYEAQETKLFQSQLNQVVAAKKANPEKSVVFCADEKHEEQVVSVSRFLSAKNGSYLHPFLQIQSTVAAQPIPISLVKLSTIRSHLFAPMNEFKGNPNHCIGVYFAGNKENCRCDETISITNLFDGIKKNS